MMKDVSLKLMFNIRKNCISSITIYHFYQERMKIGKVKKFVVNMLDKKEYAIPTINLKQALNPGLV